MRISLACDHGGLELKTQLADYIKSMGHEVVDYGTKSTDSCDYPDFAKPAALHIAAHGLEHMVEVVGLHDHIVEFKEAEPLLHSLLIALGTEHVVDGKTSPHLSQQLDIVEL